MRMLRYEAMIGDLLKQLFPALGRYLKYRLTGQVSPPHRPLPAGVARPELMNDEIGLDNAYRTPVQWPAYRDNTPAPDILADPLYQLWATTSRGHKWSHYFPIYQRVFGPRRAEPLRILEIGVLSGSSLRLWKRYFKHPDTLIVGIDIDPTCIQYDAPSANIRVRIGSQADRSFLQSVLTEFGPFDIIIDDGSHHSSHMIASFNHLYADGLKDSGIYLAEDLHANYWQPWRDSRKSFLDLCKDLLELMHAHYKAAPPGAFLINQPSDQPMLALEVPRITTMIQEIRFFDSIVAIYKAHRSYIPYYLRLMD